MMTGTSGSRPADGFNPSERAELKLAIEAVYAELGLKKDELARRRAVKERIMSAYRNGKRQPLYLVNAGLGY